MNICVYGASSATLEESYYKAAEELGRALAGRGHGLVFGGGKQGLMGATARGVREEDGYILGIAPEFFDKPDVLYEECSEFIATETMRERKQLLEERSDATIVLPGGIGTYEEFFEILTLKKIGRINRPIILYNINHYFDIMEKLMEFTVQEKFMEDWSLELYKIVSTVDEVIEYIEAYNKEEK